jgi:DNA polymerase III subunit epsilon
MLLLGLDFETTGLDFTADRIIEIGAVLWNTETGVPHRLMSVLVQHADQPPLTDEIVALTGITQEMIEEEGVPILTVWRGLLQLMKRVDAVVAHNGTGFDKPMFDAQNERLGSSVAALLLPDVLWVDTCMDVPYPEKITTRKLVHLAAEHGFLNPFAHRAVFDVLTMMTVLQRYDIAAVMESARQPTVRIRAMVTYDDREKAKARGYRWDGASKTWTKSVKAHKLTDERTHGEFPIEVLLV